MKDTDLAWLAGFIDGEGYLGLRAMTDYRLKKSGCMRNPIIRPEFSVVNCDEQMIDKANDIIKELGLNLRKKKSIPKGVKKPVFSIYLKGNKRMSLLLVPILPYLTGGKKTRAELILKFANSRIKAKTYKNPFGSGRVKPYSEEEIAIWKECQPLMRRGKLDRVKNLKILEENAKTVSNMLKLGNFEGGNTGTVWNLVEEVLAKHSEGLTKESIVNLLYDNGIFTNVRTIQQYISRNHKIYKKENVYLIRK